jgi:hypothetical protein
VSLGGPVPAIAVAFAVLAALLLWVVIGSRGHWALKLPLVVGGPLLMFAIWGALDSFTGWPAREPLPARSTFLAASVVEPDPRAGTEGAIRVWVIPRPGGAGPLELRPDGSRPRAFELPYTREAHRQVEAASRLAARGQRVELRREGEESSAEAAERKGRSTGRDASGGFRAYRLPPPSPPRKG